MMNWCRGWLNLTAIISLPLSFLLPLTAPASASDNFGLCIAELVESGLEEPEAGVACAGALEPAELSFCVSAIEDDTPVEAQEALASCYRVRRPIDLAYCVVDIHEETSAVLTTEDVETELDITETEEFEYPPAVVDNAILALDTCRRSLLPSRFSECVVELSQSLEAFAPTDAMLTCIQAESYPRELFPVYTTE